MRKFYAHSLGNNVNDWQELETHLRNVAQLASDFALNPLYYDEKYGFIPPG